MNLLFSPQFIINLLVRVDWFKILCHRWLTTAKKSYWHAVGFWIIRIWSLELIYWSALIGLKYFVINDWLQLKKVIGTRWDFEFTMSSMTDYGYEVSLLEHAEILAIINGLPCWLRLLKNNSDACLRFLKYV